MAVTRPNTKSAAAFRTISEVSRDLDIPQHVLRFWETKFAQVRPLKRGGGRRYYRPDDVELLRQIRTLLYTDGYTIKGVQRLLKDGSLTQATAVPPSHAPSATAAPSPSSVGVRRAEIESLIDDLAELRDILRGGAK